MDCISRVEVPCWFDLIHWPPLQAACVLLFTPSDFLLLIVSAASWPPITPIHSVNRIQSGSTFSTSLLNKSQALQSQSDSSSGNHDPWAHQSGRWRDVVLLTPNEKSEHPLVILPVGDMNISANLRPLSGLLCLDQSRGLHEWWEIWIIYFKFMLLYVEHSITCCIKTNPKCVVLS